MYFSLLALVLLGVSLFSFCGDFFFFSFYGEFSSRFAESFCFCFGVYFVVFATIFVFWCMGCRLGSYR